MKLHTPLKLLAMTVALAGSFNLALAAEVQGADHFPLTRAEGRVECLP